jgi:hypothetical protein
MKLSSVVVMLVFLGLSACAGRPVNEETKQELVKTYTENYWRLEPCYNQYGNGGRISTAFDVRTNGSGQIQFADVVKDGHPPYESNREFDECAKNVIMSLTLPPNSEPDYSGFRARLPVIFPYKN